MDYKLINVFLVCLIIVILIFTHILDNKEDFTLSQRIEDAFRAQNRSSTQQSGSSTQQSGSSTQQSGSSVTTSATSEEDETEEMLESLRESERICNELSRSQNERDNEELLRLQTKKLEELEIQDNKIEQLKDVLKNLRLEKLKKDQIYQKCKSDNQNKINQDYELVKKMASQGLIKDESLNLDVNLSDYFKKKQQNRPNIDTMQHDEKLSLLVNNLRGDNMNNEDIRTIVGVINNINQTRPELVNYLIERVNEIKDPKEKLNFILMYRNNTRPRHKTKFCPNMDKDKYVSGEKLKGKCHGCNVESLRKNINHLKKDFSSN